MAKSESRGKGAKDGAAERAASSASTDGAGGAAKKTGRAPAGGAAAKKRSGGAAAGLGDGSPALEGGATKKAARGGAAKKPPAGAAAKKRSGGTGAAGGPRDLRGELREFARSRPGGWGHGDWVGLLSDLRGRGHDVSDEGAVGMQLERERLAHQLEGVDGVRGKQAEALVDRFETLYSLRQASVDDIAGVQGVGRQAAERIKERFG